MYVYLFKNIYMCVYIYVHNNQWKQRLEFQRDQKRVYVNIWTEEREGWNDITILFIILKIKEIIKNKINTHYRGLGKWLNGWTDWHRSAKTCLCSYTQNPQQFRLGSTCLQSSALTAATATWELEVENAWKLMDQLFQLVSQQATPCLKRIGRRRLTPKAVISAPHFCYSTCVHTFLCSYTHSLNIAYCCYPWRFGIIHHSSKNKREYSTQLDSRRIWFLNCIM